MNKNVFDLEDIRDWREALKNIDFDKIYRDTGIQYKYLFSFGRKNKPDAIQTIECFTKDKMTAAELEELKQRLMKQMKLPLICFELVSLGKTL